MDVLFSKRRDMAAAKAFFRSAKAVTGTTPDRVTTDGHDSYPRAIHTELGKAVRHHRQHHMHFHHRNHPVAREAAAERNSMQRQQRPALDVAGGISC